MTDLIHKDGKSTGASIDLITLQKELGYVPHPAGLCENPGPQQEIWIALAKNSKNKLTDIPGILNWTGTNIGYYEGDEFVCTVEDDEIDPEDSKFYVFWE